jgi:hypothetical protein
MCNDILGAVVSCHLSSNSWQEVWLPVLTSRQANIGLVEPETLLAVHMIFCELGHSVFEVLQAHFLLLASSSDNFTFILSPASPVSSASILAIRVQRRLGVSNTKFVSSSIPGYPRYISLGCLHTRSIHPSDTE